MSPELPLLDEEERLYDGPAPDEPIPEDEPHFQLFGYFAEIILRKRELEREVDRINKEIERISPPLANFLAAYPQFSPVTVGRMSIFRRSDIYPKPKEHSSRQEVCDVLRATDLGHYVFETFNTRSLGSYVKDLKKTHKDKLVSGKITDVSELLPPMLAEVLDITPKVTLVGQRTKPKG